jgi:hypothetical protein
MAQFRDLYTIYAIDLSGQPLSAKPSTLTINVKRNSIPQNNDDFKNPQDITMYIIIISETRAVIDCTKGTARVEV